MNRISGEKYFIQSYYVFEYLPAQDGNLSNRVCAFKDIIQHAIFYFLRTFLHEVN